MLPLCVSIHSLLPSLPALIPSLPPNPISSFIPSLTLCQKPLYLHSTSSFHLRQTKCSIVFPSVVMKWEGEDKKGVGWAEGGERRMERERKEVGGWQSLTTLPWDNTVVLFPLLQQVMRQLLLRPTSPFLSLFLSVSISHPPSATLSHSLPPSLFLSNITRVHTHIMHTWTESSCSYIFKQSMVLHTLWHCFGTGGIFNSRTCKSLEENWNCMRKQGRDQWKRFYMLRTTNSYYYCKEG